MNIEQFSKSAFVRKWMPTIAATCTVIGFGWNIYVDYQEMKTKAEAFEQEARRLDDIVREYDEKITDLYGKVAELKNSHVTVPMREELVFFPESKDFPDEMEQSQEEVSLPGPVHLQQQLQQELRLPIRKTYSDFPKKGKF